MKFIILLITIASCSKWADFLADINSHWKRKVLKSSNPQQYALNAESWITETKLAYNALKGELGFGDAASNCQIRRR